MRCGLGCAVLVIAFMVCAPAPALAQPPLEPETWLLTGTLGLGIDADGDPSLTIAGAAAFPLTSVFAIEGELGHVFSMSSGDSDGDSSLTTVHGSLLYFVNTSYVLTPYLAAGLGAGKFSHEVTNPPDDSGSTEFGFNLGAGVTYPLGNATSFRGDFRWFKHINDVPSVWRFAAGVSVRVGS